MKVILHKLLLKAAKLGAIQCAFLSKVFLLSLAYPVNFKMNEGRSREAKDTQYNEVKYRTSFYYVI